MIVNLQKKIAVNAKEFQPFVDRISAEITEVGTREFSVAFVSDRRMTELNKMFRGKDSTTDVLSFPHEPDEFDPNEENLGDIVISVERADLQARENRLTLELEIKQLMLHGVLHLLGYDHETDSGEMNKRELELRDKLGI